MSMRERASAAQLARIFPGDSEMAQRMRAFDWSRTDLGPPQAWPQNLRFAVRICLTSRFPIVMWWGSTLTMLYNDAYISFLGRVKHPAMLARSAREAWSEIWETIGPMLETVQTTANATWAEDILFFLNRELPKEEDYFTFSYSPILGENDKVDGIFCACIETTGNVVGNRRLETLRKLGVEAAVTRSVEEACKAGGAVLNENPRDIPFAVIYVMDEAGTKAQLAASVGIAEGGWQPPRFVSLAEEDSSSPLPLSAVLQTKCPAESADLSTLGVQLCAGRWPEPPPLAIVIPIRVAAIEKLAGLFVAGVSARRPLDASYRTFLDLVAGHLATAIADARAYELERKRAEGLAELDRTKTAFFNNVSHEFRTPLTLMLGPLEDELRENPGSRDRIEVAYHNSLRLLKLVNTLLDFSRIEAGRIEAVYEPADLSTYTLELASVFRSAIEKAGLRLVIDCPPLPEPIYASREMWEKIVLNLLSNAFKFTFDGEIRVALRWCGDHVELSVRDSGMGIPDSELPRIFERFHRVRGACSRTHEGTGIGLALVKELVELHGGAIVVESKVGRGTTFTVSVPRGRAHLPEGCIGTASSLASTATGASVFVEEALRWLPDEIAHNGSPVVYPQLKPVAGGNGRGKPAAHAPRSRVLLADDNADMRAYVRRLLSLHHDVIAAADGEAALAAAREQMPDLVLTDVMMPRLDGFGLVQRLRADPRTKSIPIILLSARAGEESRVEGLQHGADDYLIKPFSARELLTRVSTHLELARERKAAAEALAEMNELLQALINACPLAIATFTLEGNVSMWNPAAARMFGWQAAEVLHKPLPALPGENSEHHVRQAATRSPDTESWAGSEIRCRRKDGSVFDACIWSAPVLNAHGDRSGNMAIIADITERRQLERSLLEATEHEQRRIGQDLHDGLCQSLAGTALMANALATNLRTSNHRDCGIARRISELLLHVVAEARGIAHGLHPVQLATGGLATALHSLALSVNHLIPCELKCSKPVTVNAEKGLHLYRIAQEAVQNAIKHSKARRITISLQTDNDDVTLDVSDDGQGFDTAIPSQNGSMGLATIRYRACIIRAQCSITSAAGKGTAVQCRIPRDRI